VLADDTRIQLALREMAQMIQASVSDQEIVLVGIRAGGDVLAARLNTELQALGVVVESVGVLDITLYRDDFAHRRHWPQVRGSEIDGSLDEKHVVLCDDVLFTGRTVRAALDALLDYGRPARVLLAVLADRGGRQLPIHPDVCGLRVDVPRDQLCHVTWTPQADEDCVLAESAEV